jgi:hypothetical protein
MVVDEAHCLKNPKGARYRNMDKFNTRRRLLLTGKIQTNCTGVYFYRVIIVLTVYKHCVFFIIGTPVQNSAKELMVSVFYYYIIMIANHMLITY